MKRVIRYQTSDGIVHESLAKAKKYAESRYGNLLTKLSHDLCVIDKYVATGNYIEDNLDSFEELIRLRADCSLENPPEDEEDD